MSKHKKQQNVITQPLWLCGDTHGCFDHVVEHFLKARRDGVTPHLVFLGDMECAKAFDLELQEIRELADVWFIHGNHDTDTNQAWNALTSSAWAHKNLHGQVGGIGGWSVAGLGGVFRASIWAPPKPPVFASYQEFRRDLMARRPPRDWGLKETTKERLHLSTVFPDVLNDLKRHQARVLVSHEAPSCHPYGWSAIDDLARKMKVSHVFHGHLHETKAYPQQEEYQVMGVGFRGIVALEADGVLTVIRAGDYDTTGGLNEREGEYE